MVMGTITVTKEEVEVLVVELHCITGIMRIMMEYLKLTVDLEMRSTVQLEQYIITI